MEINGLVRCYLDSFYIVLNSSETGAPVITSLAGEERVQKKQVLAFLFEHGF